MNSAKSSFILVCMLLFIILPFFIQKRRLYFIGLAASLYVFQTGWIFYHQNGIMLGDISIFILIVMAFMSGKKINVLLMPLGLPVLVFIFWALLSTSVAVKPGWVVSEATKYFRMYLLIFGITNNIQGMREIRVILLGMFIGLAFEALLGVYQWRFGALGIWYLGERLARRSGWRTTGTFFVPSFYGNYLALMLPMAFQMFFFMKGLQRRWTFFYTAVFLVGFVALFTTYARAPWIAFVGAVFITFIWGVIKIKLPSRSAVTMVILFIFLVLFGIQYNEAVLNQFGTSRQASTDVRYPQFRIARRVINGNPLLGVGLGNYEKNSWNYMTTEELRDPYARNWAMMVHNVYLFTTAESGYVGGGSIIIWLLSILWTCWKIMRSRIINDLISIVTLGIFGGMFCICLIFTFSPDIHTYPILYQIGLFCGLLLGIKKLIRNAERKMRSVSSSSQVRILSNRKEKSEQRQSNYRKR